MTHAIPTPPIAAGSWHVNSAARAWACDAPPEEVYSFHRGLPRYEPTPALSLPTLAEQFGVDQVVVKDESSRFGLPAFKGLGVSYAMYRVICGRAGRTIQLTDWKTLREVVADLSPLSFISATDGNHGRAVAHFSRLIGVPAHVLVPDVVDAGSIQAIRDEGARVSVLAEDYDKTVRLAAETAARVEGAVLIQDTAWPGYTEIPQWIVDGYSTLFAELDEQLASPAERNGPTVYGRTADAVPVATQNGRACDWVVVTPMGVGSLAQAVVAHYRSHANSGRIAVLGVEPETAACIQTSMREDRATSVNTSSTIMDGLNCGTPSSLAWPYLHRGLDGVVAISDQQATEAVETLAGLAVAAGPCGAATLAASRLAASIKGLSEKLGFTRDTTIVLLNTEGPRA